MQERTYSHDLLKKPFLEIGAEVTCPNCHNFIARTVKKIEQGAGLKSEYLDGPTIKPGAACKCEKCGMPWFMPQTGQIHLKQGWYPKLD